MPKFTVKELLEKSNSIAALLGAKVDVYTAFKLSKFLKQAIAEIQDIEESRNALIQQFGEKQENGSYRVKEENMEAFNTEWEKIQKEEVVLNNVTIPIRGLEKAGLAVVDIINLDFMLDQEDDASETKIQLLQKP